MLLLELKDFFFLSQISLDCYQTTNILKLVLQGYLFTHNNSFW